MKNIRRSFYKWHNFIGALLALPVVITAVTAMLISVQDMINADEIFISKSFFPGYLIDSYYLDYDAELNDIKAYFTKNGIEYFGTKSGLLIKSDSDSQFVNSIPEIRAIKEFNNHIYAAGKYGLWKIMKNNAVPLLEKDIHDFGFTNDGKFFVALGKNGLQLFDHFPDSVSKDKSIILNASFGISASSNGKVSLKDLFLDLHTGKAFLGKKFEWIWINIVGGCIVLLTFTGFYLWYKKKIKKLSKSNICYYAVDE